MDLKRYYRLYLDGTLGNYNDTAQGGSQVYFLFLTAIKEWGEAQEELTRLRKYAQHTHACSSRSSYGAEKCDCGLES